MRGSTWICTTCHIIAARCNDMEITKQIGATQQYHDSLENHLYTQPSQISRFGNEMDPAKTFIPQEEAALCIGAYS